MKKGFYFILTSILAGGFCAAEITQSATFAVGQTAVQENLSGFGAEFGHQQRINNWTTSPGMEALNMTAYWELTGAGSDTNGPYALCNTRKYDTMDSGFFDGAHYRLYRENLTEGRIEKIREGTIPIGGYIAAGYMTINLGTFASAPRTDIIDDFYIDNGEIWYYAVKAKDVEGKWSDFSAPVAGVAAQTNLPHRARIETQTISNPTVGQAYLEASPLVTLSALGGTLPLTWTIPSGTLPAGMTLTSTGKIIGTAATADEATFTVRVTDGLSLTSDRTFALFRATPTGDGAIPSAPSNVVVEAGNGFLHIRWDAPPETDLTTYQLYRSRQPAAEHMERINLGSGGAEAHVDDLLFVEMKRLNPPPKTTISPRIIKYVKEQTWMPDGQQIPIELVAHPGTLPAQFLAENPGESCLTMTAPESGRFGIFHFLTGDTDDTYWSVNQFTPNHTYRMECWVYGENLSNTSLRFYFRNYTDQTVSGIVNGEWTKLSVEFTVTEWLENTPGVFGPSFRFQGPGTVYIDNAMIYDIAEPNGPCHYSQSVLDLWTDFVGPTNAPNKGVARIPYNEQPFESIMNPSVMSQQRWHTVYGALPSDPMHIHDQLKELYATGTNANTRTTPWIKANLEWTEQNFVDLVEYLSGPAGTPYGDLRIAQRGGITTPWTEEFKKIYIEMGNEAWNRSYFFTFRSGYTGRSGTTYGRWTNYIWDYVWDHCPTMSDQIKPVLGGWNTTSDQTDGFSASARRACPRANHLAMTMYIGGWEAGQEGQIGGTTWSDDGLQQWPVFLDRSGADVVDTVVGLQGMMAAEGRPFDWLVYEGGPSYLMNGLNGVSLTDEEQAVSKKYGRTLAAGIATLDYYLYGASRNIQENSFFSFYQDKGLWASHTHVHNGYRPHPSFQGLTLLNQHIAGASMLVSTPLTLPTFDLAYDKDGTTVVKPAVGLASLYAFQEDDRYAVLFLNKKVDGVHNGYDFGDGSTAASVQLPFSNPSAITLYKIDGDLRETNMDQMNIQVVTQSVDTATFSSNFVVNETSGGVSNGLPVGAIFLYVFEGCTPNPLPENPQVEVRQALGQSDPWDASIVNAVRFSILFDRPVTGFDSATDVVIGGTSGATGVSIQPITSGIFEIIVSGALRSGTITVDIPAGAALDAATGHGNDPSTSDDNTITIDLDNGVSLLEWEFLEMEELPAVGDTQPPGDTGHHTQIHPASLVVGADTKLYPPNKWHYDDSFAVHHFSNSYTNEAGEEQFDVGYFDLDPDFYIGWTVAPTLGWKMSLASIMVGAYSTYDLPFDVELRWSIDGFSTYEQVSLTPTNPLTGDRNYLGTIGTELLADLSEFPALQNQTLPVEFRFYIWNTTFWWVNCGIGKVGENSTDLIVRGFMSPSTDQDNDSLPDEWETFYYGATDLVGPSTLTSNGVNSVHDAYVAGFSPVAPTARLELSNRRNILTWPGVPGRLYTLYSTTNLLTAFHPLETDLPWTQSSVTDTLHAAESQGFYKIEVELDP